MKIQKFAFLAALAVSCGLAQAASFQNSTGLVAPTSVENFDGSVIANATAAASLFAGLSFGPGSVLSTEYDGSFPNITGQHIANFSDSLGNCCNNATYIDFSSTVSGAAFNFVSNTQGFIFSAYLAGNLVESATFSTDLSGQFVGFYGISFDRITIVGDSTYNNAYLLDNLQIAAVPEPTTYAMLLAGLGMLGFVARRKQA
jgi:hypothetical protein